MKIALVNSVDSISGAARACYRLHEGLLKIGESSSMLVKTKLTSDPEVYRINPPFGKKVDRIFDYYVRYKKRKYEIKNKVSYSLSIHPDNLLKTLDKAKPDIIHFHWFNKGFIRLETLMKIKIPIVWTLHDMWAFTGGCHYTQGCEKYLENCGACPILSSANPDDLSAEIFKRKESVYKKIPNLTVVTPSQWLGTMAKHSKLLGDIPVKVIPNGIDIEMFSLKEKAKSREKWNIPLDKKIILFGALKPTAEPRKGFNELKVALSKISDKQNIELLVFGSSEPVDVEKYGFKVNFVGRIMEDSVLSALYNAADVMVVPSLQENLSNTIVESLCCGLPVVAFDIGGNSDMIEHKICGYLAKPIDTLDLAHGIEWVLGNEERVSMLSKNARKKGESHYDDKLVASKHLALYNSLIL